MSKVDKLLSEALSEFGVDAVEDALNQLMQRKSSNEELTIIVNKGSHPVRDAHTRGEVFYATEGALDYSSAGSILDEYTDALKRVAKKLHERHWKKIYLVPFGPSVLSMHIKLLVYRVLHMETIDVLHVGNNEYIDLSLKHKGLISQIS